MAVKSKQSLPKPDHPGEHHSLATLVSKAAADPARRAGFICGLVCLGMFGGFFGIIWGIFTTHGRPMKTTATVSWSL